MNNIKIGDEVQRYNSKGEPLLGTRFIATTIGDSYIGGIDFGGDIYMFDEITGWRKTGRHYNILDALIKLRDEVDS